MVLRPASVFGGRSCSLLGLADYGLRYQRFEAMLRTTPEEQREKTSAMMEGDLRCVPGGGVSPGRGGATPPNCSPAPA